jgi:excisionase family DNA binding protein
MVDETLRPAPSFLTVAEAAKRLSVTQNRVRSLVAAGDLPASSVGMNLLIPGDAVEGRLSRGQGRGRRLTTGNAWAALYLAAGLPVAWLDRRERWRIRHYLEHHRLVDIRPQLVARGRPRAFRAHPAMLERLRSDSALMLTGTTGASELRLGLIGGTDRVEAYVAASDLDMLVGRYYLRASREPNVLLRVMEAPGVPEPRPHVAPRSAVALDLLDDPDPRAQQVGREILGEGAL